MHTRANTACYRVRSLNVPCAVVIVDDIDTIYPGLELVKSRRKNKKIGESGVIMIEQSRCT